MATAVILPDQDSFDRALDVLRSSSNYLQTLEAPEFCLGLTPPVILTTGSLKSVLAGLHQFGIDISGSIPFRPFNRDIPVAGPPDSKWKQILGGLRVSKIRTSVSDPIRLRIELDANKPFGYLIPTMARMIRGGSYTPDEPVFMFEEEHRLIAFSSQTLVISRANDLLDFWLMLRCSIDLICNAWEHRLSIEPDRKPRQGIGATEIFKRLPGTNCAECGMQGCMEFAVSVLTMKTTIDRCVPLAEANMATLQESLAWLVWALGLDASRLSRRRDMAGSQMTVSDIV